MLLQETRQCFFFVWDRMGFRCGTGNAVLGWAVIAPEMWPGVIPIFIYVWKHLPSVAELLLLVQYTQSRAVRHRVLSDCNSRLRHTYTCTEAKYSD